jgi:hypothetical protein
MTDKSHLDSGQRVELHYLKQRKFQRNGRVSVKMRVAYANNKLAYLEDEEPADDNQLVIDSENDVWFRPDGDDRKKDIYYGTAAEIEVLAEIR